MTDSETSLNFVLKELFEVFIYLFLLDCKKGGGGRNVRILEECLNMEGFDACLRWKKNKTQYGVMETNGNTLTTSLFIFE